MAQDTEPATAEILHTATVVLTIVTLTALAALACILLTWATARIVRRRRAHQQATLRPVESDTQSGLGLPARTGGQGMRTAWKLFYCPRPRRRCGHRKPYVPMLSSWASSPRPRH